MERKQTNNHAPSDDQKPVHERTGSTLHNDYKIKGDEQPGKDEAESYQDYNGNSESNNPAKAEEE
ncbi:MAG: hypothetical protein H0U44_10740 [Flavisolibacter sp.]|jgi:hypothetical protein|nr:hypothetical protein [Flavisolibacter sp.]